MVHNGIEYGLMQAYAEGFDIFRNATSKEVPEEHRYDLNLPDIAEVWRRGSVVSSWLLDLTAIALAENPTLAEYTGFVQDSGEGRWTIQAAIDEAVPVDVLSAALVHPLPFAPGTYVRGKNALRHAATVRRSRRAGNAQEVAMAQTEVMPAVEPPRIGKPGDPCTMVIFGASGDLTRRKLIPALYNLAKNDLLSREFAVIGVARAPCPRRTSARKPRKTSSNSPPTKSIPTSGSGSCAALYYLSGDMSDKNSLSPAEGHCSTKSTKTTPPTAITCTTWPPRRTFSAPPWSSWLKSD